MCIPNVVCSLFYIFYEGLLKRYFTEMRNCILPNVYLELLKYACMLKYALFVYAIIILSIVVLGQLCNLRTRICMNT